MILVDNILANNYQVLKKNQVLLSKTKIWTVTGLKNYKVLFIFLYKF
jgi:phytoene/squalene synthetase